MTAEMISSTYKTVLCVHFKNRGSCDVGSHCNFAHGSRELRSYENPLYKAQLCTAYEQGGMCQMGCDCLFAHGEEELRSDDIFVPNGAQTNEPAVTSTIPFPLRNSKTVKEAKNLFKSTLCIHFTRHGSCNLGDKCTFAHGKEDLVNATLPDNKDPKYKTKLCLRYAQDKFCPSGDYCVFAHDENELKQSPEDVQKMKSRLFKTTLCHNFSTLGVCPSGKNCGFAHGRFELRPVGFEGDFEAKIKENPKWKCTLCKIFAQSGFCNKPGCDFAHGDQEVRVEAPENPRVLRSNYKRVMCNKWAKSGHCFHEDTCSFAHGEEELQMFSASKDVAGALKLFRASPGLGKRPRSEMSQTGMGTAPLMVPPQVQFAPRNTTMTDQKLFAEFLEFKKFKEQTEGTKFMPGVAMQQQSARPAMTPYFDNFQGGSSMKRSAMSAAAPTDPRLNRFSINVKNTPMVNSYSGEASAEAFGKRTIQRNGNRSAVMGMSNAMFNVRNDAFAGQEMDHAFVY